MSSKPKIALDLDGVYLHIQQTLVSIRNHVCRENIREFRKYSIAEQDGKSVEDAVMKILSKRGDFRDMHLLPHAREGLEYLEERATVYFVTRRHLTPFYGEDRAKQDTFECLNFYKTGISKDRVIFSGNKAEVARAHNFRFAVEDSYEEAIALAELVPVFLFDNYHTPKISHPNITLIPGKEDESWWINFMKMLKTNPRFFKN